MKWYNLTQCFLLGWGPCYAGNLSALKMHRLDENNQVDQLTVEAHRCLRKYNTWPTNHLLANKLTLECPVYKFTNHISSFVSLTAHQGFKKKKKKKTR